MPESHVPALPQLWGTRVLRQPVWPGAHTPVHAPLMHVWLLVVHEVPTVQVPVALQLSGSVHAEQLV